MSKFRKKPVVVDAVQWTGNEIEMKNFIGTFTTNLGRVVVRTLEGDMYANYGDWVIRGVRGEFYPCKDYIFTETYEDVL